eukprot:m.196340 g.196340  ORF g.196340 m.196340 type:complete len:129 (+) comp18690_c0_seq6:220-606(+)
MSINKLEKYIFVGCMATMSITAMVFEPYVVFDENGTALTQDALDSNPSDIVRHLWAWYAKSFDPIFLETPLFLRIMCGVDMAIFGPLQAAIGFALWTLRCEKREGGWHTAKKYMGREKGVPSMCEMFV